MPISARVIVNTASMKLRRDEIDGFITEIEKAKETVNDTHSKGRRRFGTRAHKSA